TGASATIVDTFDDQEKTDAPLELLSIVSLVVQQGRMTVSDLEALLDCEFINPGRTVTIDTADDAAPDDQCNPTALRLQGNSPALLDRLHRFIRIQRRLGWKTPDLDLALRAIYGQPNVTADVVVQALADLERVRVRLNLPIELLVTGLYGFDRIAYNTRPGDSRTAVPPLYERRFQNPEVLTPGGTATAPTPRAPDPQLSYAAPSNTNSPTTIGDKLNASAAASGVRAGDVLPLLAVEAGFAPPPQTVDATTRLRVAHLQTLVRAAALVQALHMSMARLISLIDLLG